MDRHLATQAHYASSAGFGMPAESTHYSQARKAVPVHIQPVPAPNLPHPVPHALVPLRANSLAVQH